MKSPPMKSVRLLQEKYQENMEIMLKNLLKDESLSDITIHCIDGYVKAHKVILAACSPYFKKIFSNHPDPKVAYILHGVSVKQMKSLIELMYRGTTDISCDMTNKIFQVAEDFGVSGVVDENEKNLNNCGRDTRYKGQKRVAVDFIEEEIDGDVRPHSPKASKNETERRISICSDKSPKKSTENVPDPLLNTPSPTQPSDTPSPISPVKENQKPESPSTVTPPTVVPLSSAARRSSNWAMKQRKYICSLCPASFKRASHLTRHQLVHTGERPYACNQCDKAFSRHDKLKHHIRRAHEMVPYDDMLSPENLYTIGHVEVLGSNSHITEEETIIRREDLIPRVPVPEKASPAAAEDPSTPSEKPSSPKLRLDMPVSNNPQKKGRGRPRKYPPVPRPLIKRPRGRPRLNPIVPLDSNKNDNSEPQPRSTENYDITNMPFGDLEYLTKPLTITENTENLDEAAGSIEPNIMEPLVEIKLESTELQETQEPEHTAGSFFQNIGLLETSAVAKIGECTISVANTPGP